MTNARKLTIAIAVAAGVLGATLLWLYAEQLDDEHQSLVADQVEVVKAAREMPAGSPMTKERITTERVPRKFLPPNPLLESELNIYLGNPLAVTVQEGAMILTTDFSHALADASGSLDHGPASTGQEGRLVIKTARLTIRGENPREMATRLSTLSGRAGGFVVSSSSRGVGEATSVTMRARIPADVFDDTLAAFRREGEIISEEISGSDVTEKFIDLDAQVRNQKKLELRMLELLEKAKTVDEAIEVEEKVARVRTDAEKLEGRAKALRQQTALSTVDVTITAPVTEGPPSAEPSLFEPIERAFSRSGHTMVKMFALLVEVTATVIPFALFFGPIFFAGHTFWRRRRPPSAERDGRVDA